MAEVIAANFRSRLGRGYQRVNAEPGVAFAVTPRVLAVPTIDGGERFPILRLAFFSPGRPQSWVTLGLGGQAPVFGRLLTFRSAVFEGGRLPARLVIDLED